LSGAAFFLTKNTYRELSSYPVLKGRKAMTTREKPITKSQTHMHTPSAPSQLATVTDLSKDEVQAITDVVNPLIADSFALYVKTKNYHWHMSGSHFRDYHLLLDDQADSILASVDPMAERVRRIGGTTIRSISHISKLQSIEDDNSDFVPPGEIIQHLAQDNANSAQKYRSAIEVCDRNRDSATSNTLQELLDEVERRKWFLFEVMQGQKNTD
jgi:starvation-inducible DNA-binding protein